MKSGNNIEDGIRQALKSCHNIKGMLEAVPRECQFLFVPESIEDLQLMETRAARLKDQENRRNEVMYLQRKNDLPLRPNTSLRELKTTIRIMQKKKAMRDWGKNHSDNNRNW